MQVHTNSAQVSQDIPAVSNADQADFWRASLAGAPPLLELPCDYTRPSQASNSCAIQQIRIPFELNTQVQALAQRHGVTLFIVLLTAWGSLLARLSGQADLVIGAAPHTTPDETANPWPVRIRLDDAINTTNLLQQVKQTTNAACAHPALPAVQLAAAMHVPHSVSFNPIFQTLLHLSSSESDNTQGQISTTPYENLDLSLRLSETAGELHGALIYASDLFTSNGILRIAQQFQTLLSAMCADQDMPVTRLALLDTAQKNQLLHTFNDTRRDYPQPALLHAMFEEQVARTPHAIAVRFEEQSLTYDELNRRANRLAHHLRSLGVGPDKRVALCLERSFEMVIGLMAVLKAGGAYVPLEPSYPHERISYMLADSAPMSVLTSRALQAMLHTTAPMLLLDELDLTNGLAEHNPVVENLLPRHLAYVIYTSGSTGQPKGTMNQHDGVANRLQWAQETYGIGPHDRIMQKTPFGFDVSVWEFFLPLISGAQLVMARPGGHKDPAYLRQLVQQAGVTLMHFVPSMLQVFLHHSSSAAPACLRRVLCCGEALPYALQQAFYERNPHVELHNLYGPTEASIEVTAIHCRPDSYNGIVPIGRPIANNQMYVLDQHMQPTPLNVTGEIYIGGIAVGRGYLNRPELTAERFIPDPFSSRPGACLYKTGDLGRWLEDGVLEYLGRNDFQVKLRGFRIELGEIEARLLQCPGVRETVVLAREDTPGDKRLVAYVVMFAGEQMDAASLRQALSENLAEFMIPSAFVQMPQFPLTPNGKLDRKALPAPDAQSSIARDYIAPQGELENMLAETWRELLHLPQIGRHEHFFELGGNSLIALQLVARLRQRLGVELHLRDVFAAPTLAAMALLTAQHSDAVLPVLQGAARTQDLPLSWPQLRLWFLDRLDSAAGAAYNMPTGLRLQGHLELPALQAALDALLARHEILRTVFVDADGEPRQQILAPRAFALSRHDLRTLSGHEQSLAVQYHCQDEIGALFDLAQGPLIRARLLQLSEAEHLLILVQHHIISDGWSVSLLLQELDALYDAFRQNLANPLPPLKLQYADYAVWQRSQERSADFARHLEYWRNHLHNVTPLLELPSDHPRPAQQSFRGETVEIMLPATLSTKLHDFSQQHGVTLYMSLLLSWGILMSRMSGQNDIVIGVPVANRNQAELEALPGFFVNTLPLRIQLQAGMRVNTLLQQVKDNLLNALAHQTTPFDHIVEAVQPARSMSYNPLFQTLLTLNNAPMLESGKLGDLMLQEQALPTQAARSDLGLSITPVAQGLRGELEYASDLFERNSIERLLQLWRSILQDMLTQEDQEISRLAWLDEPHRDLVLHQFNAHRPSFARFGAIQELFEQQAAAQPAQCAIMQDGFSISYGELNQKANQFAHYLLAHGLQQGERVALCMPPSWQLIVSLLALWKAGAVYVPLDSMHPQERLQYMLHDSAASLLLCHGGLEEKLHGATQTLMLFEHVWPELSEFSATAPVLEWRAAESPTAYLIYTSGSTGKPKGVMNHHAGLLNLTQALIQEFGLCPGQRMLQFASIGFDVSVSEITLTLCSGASLCIASRTDLLPGPALRETLQRFGVTHAHLPSTLLRALGEQDVVPPGVTIITGGEAIAPAVLQRLAQTHAVYNCYGPTEATVCATWQRCSADPQQRISIGRPLANVQVYILDPHMQPVPIGVAGELYIGGAGVASGYMQQEELNRERFLPNPFTPGGRMYRSGDYARWLADGQIAFIGRLDNQVKLRGYRIELGEIEAALLDCPQVRDAAVTLRHTPHGEAKLIAYISSTPQAGADCTAILEQLRRSLPEYMCPAHIIVLECLPRTMNGKTDYAALPDAQTGGAAGPLEAARTPLEAALSEIYAELLDVPQVSVSESFFGLGGHSLLAVRLVARVRQKLQLGIELRDVFNSPSVRALATRLEHSGALQHMPILAAPRDQALPLSWEQQRLWFLDRMGGGASAAYNMALCFDLYGPLQIGAMQAALDALIARHEVLRSSFGEHAGQAYLQIMPAQTGLRLRRHDLRPLPAAAQQAAQAALLERLCAQAFDLAQGPLIRADLLELENERHILLLVQHHIISDAESIAILVQELRALYCAFSADQPDPLPSPGLQYADYAFWQRQWLQDPAIAAQMDFWRQHLDGAPPLLELPTDHPRPLQQSYAGGAIEVHIPAALSAQIKAFGQSHGATLFMTLLSAWSVLLSRLSGQQDVVIGAPVANRQRTELESMPGFFVNTLALRVQLPDEISGADLLQQVKHSVIAAFAHQNLPFDQVVEALQPARSLSYSPLFQASLTLNNDIAAPAQWGALQAQEKTLFQPYTKFDLSLLLTEQADGLHGELVFASDLFETASVQRIAAQFEILLRALCADPHTPVARLPLLDAAQSEMLLHSFNATRRNYPEQALLHQLFEQQAAQTPHAIALRCAGHSLSYAELNRRANQLAHHLLTYGAGPDQRIAICLERGIDMVVSMLAVLKAGAAYLPLDPNHPLERIMQTLEHAAPSACILRSEQADRLPWLPLPLLALEEIDALLQGAAQENPPASAQGLHSRHLACVMYTSGSTGAPKGVMVEHRSILRLICNNGFAELCAQDKVAHCANPAFDAATWEIWGALLNGATLCIFPHETVLEPQRFLQGLLEMEVSVLWLTIGLFNQYAETLAPAFARLRYLLTGGDVLDVGPIAKLFASGQQPAHFVNCYGPTETTTFATTYEITANPAGSASIPIGRPIGNTRIYVLDKHLQPVPLGVCGEIYIGGPGVARAYLFDAELSASRFLADPFEPGATMYKTGDLGCWRADGNLEYQGRSDTQIKLRGYRIELSEIEAHLAQCRGVQQACVCVKHGAAGEKRLVAYLIAKPGAQLALTELRAQLAGKLADYMLPSAMVTLEQFPLTPSGKLDRRALPEPDQSALVTHAFEAPADARERLIAAIWQELLGATQIGRQDNFFELGGHSLLAVQFIARLRQAHDIEAPLQTLFAHPGLADFARAIATAQASDGGLILPADRTFPLPLSWAQQRLWFLDQLDSKAGAAYHLPSSFTLKGNLDVAALQRALDQLVARHEILRTSFVDGADGPQQLIAAADSGFPLALYDLRDLPASQQAAQIEAISSQTLNHSFKLSQGPLIRAALLQLDAQNHILLLVKHHIISDGWSNGVLVHELSVLYNAFRQGGPNPLPPLPIQYADYAVWQRNWLQGANLAQQVAFWRQHLAGAPPLLELPTDRARPGMQSYAGAAVHIRLPATLSSSVKALAQRHGATLFMTLFAAWGALLARLSGQRDLVIGVPVANRQRTEVEPLIGFFVNTLALRIQLPPDCSVAQLLQQVKTTTIAAFAHQDLPFEQVVEALQPERSLSYSPLFQVVFGLLNTPGEHDIALHGLQITHNEPPHHLSQFELAANLVEEGDEINFGLSYQSAIYERATVERILQQFQTLLEGMTQDGDQTVARLPLLNAQQYQQLIRDFNRTGAAFPRHATLPQLFEAQVAQTPQAEALIFQEQRITYAELNQRANRLAHLLLQNGVQNEDRVAICLPRSADMLIAILATLKAGAAYVPLDPAYPAQRLNYMLQDSAPQSVISTSAYADLADWPAHRLLCLDSVAAQLASQSDANPALPASAAQLAYVMYTSGSTGQPKGVMVEQRNIMRLVLGQQYAPITAQDCVVHCANPAFDAATWEIWAALLHGARLLVIAHDTLLDPHAFANTLQAEQANVLHLTIGLFNQYADPLAQVFGQLKYLLFGGERADLGTVLRVLGQRLPGRLVHCYGPTETTTFATTYGIAPGAALPGALPIGKPIANTSIYILDAQLQPVPLGVPGEIYIGGEGVTRGYWRQAELTQERFLPDPFSATPQQRMYRSGDLGRWLPDGNIEYLGRNDMQIKIRGYRIEPGEIEAKLATLPEVQEALVMAREDQPGNTTLVAYVALQAGAQTDGPRILAQLRSMLPDYMTPDFCICMDNFPLTANGKLDRQRLPAPQLEAQDAIYQAPLEGVETQIAAIWCEILGLQRVSQQAHFFQSGGHSLLAVQLVIRVREQFGVDFSLRTVFEHPTLAAMADYVTAQQLAAYDQHSLLALQDHINQLSEDELLALLAEE
ncbi:amino acid adenylation domain-containing protein [Massilia sp. W12]|uniref:amino acid adenylation domain-containing protein n=1 Tax=Massilia sp. W12 TaxID=3126507 RepID=UPI0030CA7FD6